MGLAAFVLVGTVLAVLAYALWVGVVLPKTPRTALEMQLSTLEQVVAQNPRDPKVWAQYADALIQTKQYSKAATVIEQGRKALPGQTSLLTVEEAYMAHLRGLNGDALRLYDKATAQAQAERKKKLEELKAKGIISAPEAPAIISAGVGKGDLLLEMRRWADAAGAYSKALEEDPRMSDVLVRRGDAYLELKDYAKARADFESALTFIPDYKDARAGLEKLKAVGK
jgi:tetratricopeptide (TPR) repeat protein